MRIIVVMTIQVYLSDILMAFSLLLLLVIVRQI